MLPKVIYNLNVISTKMPIIFFIELEKIILKFIWKHKRCQVAKAIMKKKSNARGTIMLNFKLYCRAIETKTV
jgi:hypothetical protein